MICMIYMWIYMTADKSRPWSLRLRWFRDLTKAPVKPLVKILINPVFTRVKGLTGTCCARTPGTIPHFTSGQTWRLRPEGGTSPTTMVCCQYQGGWSGHWCKTLLMFHTEHKLWPYTHTHTHFISTDFGARGKLGITKIQLPIIIYQRRNHSWQHKLLLESFKETIVMQILAPAGGSVSLLLSEIFKSMFCHGNIKRELLF